MNRPGPCVDPAGDLLPLPFFPFSGTSGRSPASPGFSSSLALIRFHFILFVRQEEITYITKGMFVKKELYVIAESPGEFCKEIISTSRPHD